MSFRLNHILFALVILLWGGISGSAQSERPASGLPSPESYIVADSIPMDSLMEEAEVLGEVTVRARQAGVRKLRSSVTNTDLISASEMRRAACCNLGESFTTNPSVDVTYSDAATGAKQIKMLGLSGSYVQILTENIPNLRGAGSLYGLGYIPGPWMQSIQVSKGASSVKNGYESVTGQINVEFLKPQSEQSLLVNGYADLFGKAEVNAAGNLHLTDKWSGGLLLHAENGFAAHDENNDGFIDLPQIKQISAMNRWAYFSDNYIFQAGIKFLGEERLSGQDTHHGDAHIMGEPYKINIDTRRWELFAKNAYLFDHDNDANIALILSGSWHSEDAHYGHKLYAVEQENIYASLIFERKWAGGLHELSTGASFNYDRYNQRFRFVNDADMLPDKVKDYESVPGVYAQYTYNLNSRLLLMGGFRYDHSSVYGSMLTPRLHAKWNLLDGALSIHGSAGRGYRSPHPLAENHFLLASSRRIIIGSELRQEVAMNYGGGITGFVYLFGRPLNLNGEFYYTTFSHQLLVDLDSDPHAAIIKDSGNRASFSRTVQLDASYPIISELNFSVSYRFTDVRVDYGYGLVQKPLTSRNKGLFSLSWTPMMGLWQADLTLALNGGGRMPAPYVLNDGTMAWERTYKAFPQLNAQLTRNFKHWAVYVGGENLTGFRQKHPIIDAANPWGNNFDATMVYGPIHGAMIYAGFRYTLTKY